MAGDWIKMRKSLTTCPKVAVVCRLTKLDTYAVCGRLLALWSWADEHTTDGDAPGIDTRYIDTLVGRRGFGEALTHEHVGWVEVTGDGVRFPDYEKHNGATGRTRAQAQRRQAKKRDECHGPVTNRSRTKRDNSVTREEKRREEEKTPPLPPSGGSRDLGGGLCPKVGEAERQAAYDAMNAWSEADRRTPLLTPHGEHTRFWKALDEIADMPKVATPTGLIPAAALVPKAVLVKRSQGTKFKNVAFAVGCVRTLIQEWSVVGVADGANVAETASEKRLRLAREQEGAA